MTLFRVVFPVAQTDVPVVHGAGHEVHVRAGPVPVAVHVLLGLPDQPDLGDGNVCVRIYIEDEMSVSVST